MTYALLALCLALLAFGSVNALESLALAAWFRLGRRERTPGQTERAILLLRSLPAAVSLLFVSALFLPAFILLEPRETGERVTPSLLLLASGGALVLVAGPIRALLASLATRRLVREWERSARPLALPGLAIPAWVVEESFPLVTVVGVFRPRLYIARQVLEGCSPAELAAIVSHEIAHVANRDNWKRLLLRSFPDWLSLTPLASRLESAWSQAAEEAADDQASRRGASLDLAGALIKVARWARPPHPELVPASALYRGEGVARRVGRLLQPPGPSPTSRAARSIPRLAIGLGLLATGLGIGIRFGLLESMHQLTETVVRLLQ